MAKLCVIDNCKENAYGYYPLCKKHLDRTKTGEVLKNKDGKWIEVNVKNLFNKIDNELNIEEKENNTNIKCLLCGEPT